MTYEEQQAQRKELNDLMESEDDFYIQFNRLLDEHTSTEGAISQKNKELIGLAISICTRCNECISYHIGGCKNSGATKAEMLEAIKIGVAAGGSITYPNVRFAFSALREIGLL